MPRYHNFKSSGRRVEIEFGQVVYHVNRNPFDLDRFSNRQLIRPPAAVIIAAHSRDGRKAAQGCEYGFATNISGVNNAVHSNERLLCFLANQIVSV
jgi:hypothetical protein